jgi:phage baseplate assembly protein gpV
VVTRVDDPERLGRVRVALPTMGDLETDWLEVLSPGAGQEKGLVVPPDVDDRVLVLLAHEDPAQAVVLGGLYGTEGPPDPGVEEGAIRRYTLRTPGGQQVRLDDGRRTVRVENESGSHLQLAGGRARVAISDGSRFELTRDGVQLRCETDLTIEAPGRSIVIRAGSIDFERG